MCRSFCGTVHQKENEGGNDESIHYRHSSRYRGRCCQGRRSVQGMFAMIMLVDISKCNVGHEELHKRCDALAAEMGMQINVTRQEVFDAMHTI